MTRTRAEAVPGASAAGSRSWKADRRRWLRRGAVLSALIVGFVGLPAAADHSGDLPAVQEPEFVEEVRVNSADPRGASTIQPLVQGRAYIFEVSGRYAWGLGDADAECSATNSDPVFRRDRYPTIGPHVLDLVVDGVGVEWQAVTPDAEGCDVDHTYKVRYQAPKSGPVNFKILEGYQVDNAGILTVKVSQADGVPPGGTLVDSFTVSSAKSGGTTSTAVLDDAKQYRIVAAGSFTFGFDNQVHDAECLFVDNLPGQRLDAADVAGRAQDLLVNGTQVDWMPTSGLSGCNAEDHTYLHEFSPAKDGKVNLAVRDAFQPDNRGVIDVKILEIASPSGPALPTDPGAVPSASDVTVFENVLVDSRSSTGASTIQPLLAGRAYTFEVSGVFQWGLGKADAECANLDSDPLFLRDRFSHIGPHVLDLLVDGKGVEWQPVSSDPQGCDTTNHAYRIRYVPEKTARVNFRVNEGNTADNRGTLTVRVTEAQGVPPGGTLVDSFTVSSASVAGTTSSVTLDDAKRYRLVARGSFTFAFQGQSHDAECFRIGVTPGTRLDAVDAAGRGQDLLVNQAAVDWTSARGHTGCDDTSHTYFYEFSPSKDGRVNLAVRDAFHPDNQGTLAVEVYEIPATAASALGVPSGVPSASDVSLVEEVRVDSANPNGATTVAPLVAGELYRFEVTGTYAWGLGHADAECANLDSDAVWLRDRYSTISPHVLDLIVNGAGLEWQAVTPDANGCDSTDHAYVAWYVPATSGRVNFNVNEGYRGDNSGVLAVRITVAEGLPPGGTLVDSFTVSSASAGGTNSTVVLDDAKTYRVVASGSFTFAFQGQSHDAECLQVSAAPGQRLDLWDRAGSGQDLLVGGKAVDWISSRGHTGCNDTDHTYFIEMRPATDGKLHVKVRDAYHPDNQGVLKISIYEIAQPSAISVLRTGTTVAVS